MPLWQGPCISYGSQPSSWSCADGSQAGKPHGYKRLSRVCTVPVALYGLGRKRGDDAKVLAQPVQQPAGHHDLVPYLQGPHRANLELPLPRHHLSVDAADNEARLLTTRRM